MPMTISDAVFVYLLQDEEQIRWHSRTHTHGTAEYELHYFIHGEGAFKNAGVTYSLSPGSLFLSAPGDIHTVMPASKTHPLTYYAILFNFTGNDTELNSLLDNIINYRKNYSVGTNYRFFFEELKDKFLSHNRARVNSGIHQFISFLYMLTDGAGGFHYGDSSNSHIERSLRIIEAASSMLISTPLPIYTIAERLCFYSEFHFSKCFKQYKGLPPREYRTYYAEGAGNDGGKISAAAHQAATHTE